MRVPSGWPIVGWAAAVVAAIVAALLAVAGTDEAGIRLVIRATARTSVVLFTAAFVAASLNQAWPGVVSRWMLANRRYLGVSFAVSHLAHLLAIFALAGWSPARAYAAAGLPVVLLGGTAYLFVLAMVATSFDRTAAWLGPRAWRRLHGTGVWVLWAVFFASFVPRVAGSPVYWPFALLVVAAPVLRVAYGRRRAPKPALSPATP
jgi:methionine sulfoxide reductase heme-binding subunit